MSESLTTLALAACALLVGCARSPDLCYDDGVADCEGAVPMEPAGNDECEDQYVAGYNDCAGDLTTTTITTLETLETLETE